MIERLQSPTVLMIVPAHMEHLAGAKRLADCFKRELGFINRATLQKAIETQQVLVALCQSAQDEQGDGACREGTALVGMVHFYVRRDQIITLYNIVVAQAYQRRGFGRQLFEALVNVAETLGTRQIRLKCPVDLSANLFYEYLGMEHVEVEPGKRRPLNIWTYTLQDGVRASD